MTKAATRSEAIAAFAAELAAERFFEAHEVLEEFWQTLDRASEDALRLQGLIQAAVALEHAARGRPDRGARLARKALPKLEGLKEVDGYDPDPLRQRLVRLIADGAAG